MFNRLTLKLNDIFFDVHIDSYHILGITCRLAVEKVLLMMFALSEKLDKRLALTFKYVWTLIEDGHMMKQFYLETVLNPITCNMLR